LIDAQRGSERSPDRHRPQVRPPRPEPRSIGDGGPAVV